MDWTFGIQYSPGRSWLVDLGYIGNSGNNLTTSINNANQVNPKYMYSYGALLNQPINSPAVMAAGFTPPYPNFVQSFPYTPTLAQALRPFPQYGSVDYGPNSGPNISGSANDGHSTYHALQAKVQKQLTQGLFLMSAFTWSKKITNADSSWGGGNYPGGLPVGQSRDTYNLALEKARAQSNVPARLTGVFLYELPFGPGRKFLHGGGLAGKVLQGWQIEGDIDYQSGYPIVVFAPDTLPIFNYINTPNSVPGVNPCQAHSSGFDPSTMLGLNPAAYTLPVPFTFGTAGVFTQCNSFALENEDFGLMKKTTIGEKVSLEFRMEAFDAFNRHQFEIPDGHFGTASFGKTGGQNNGPRVVQLAMRLLF
jgi:hypothetical protein